MTFRIDGALAAAFVISFLCAFGASAKAETAANDGKQRAHAAHRVHKQAASAPRIVPSNVPHFDQTRPWTFAWGAPPLQDPRDAYHGYFANPVDDPRYYGGGRTTLIFR